MIWGLRLAILSLNRYKARKPPTSRSVGGKEGETCKSESPINGLFGKSGAVIIDMAEQQLTNSIKKVLAVMLYVGTVLSCKLAFSDKYFEA